MNKKLRKPRKTPKPRINKQILEKLELKMMGLMYYRLIEKTRIPQ